ncbi:hypothetical protein [Pandoraea commovens]|uniref:Integrase n=1 Tax=Pandoraea commovens TaxID=2508289 RepID=A0A5E4RJL2_9BURK|nr:hypothetical protein [Pandoraea commovens]VVD62672.1 hypothetical protein PCO31010_00190 [Pandoraea commovens]
MTPQFEAYIGLGKRLMLEKGINWDFMLDDQGKATDGIGWPLSLMAGDVPPPAFYLRDLSVDPKALEIYAEKFGRSGELKAKCRPLSVAWQDLIKAAVAEQLLFKRNTAPHAAQQVARPLRVLATCTTAAPWALTMDDFRSAMTVASEIQRSGQLSDRIVGLARTLFDTHHLLQAGPIYGLLAQKRLITGPSRIARHTWSEAQLRDDLSDRKRAERLPEKRAFWELVRIITTEKPQTFVDALRFVALQTMIVSGLRISEVALLPADCLRERDYFDRNGSPAAHAGGISKALLLRHFAEKQHDENSDSRLLIERLQPVPTMFESILRQALERVSVMTAPLRHTLRLQCETGRILPWYGLDDLVPFRELYPHLTGNPFFLDIEQTPYFERYRSAFDPAVFDEIHADQLAAPTSTRLNMALYIFGNRLKALVSSGKTTLRFRRSDGSPIPVDTRMSWPQVYLHVGELEAHLRVHTPTKLSDTSAFPIEYGTLQPWEFMFLHPKRSVAEERNTGICDVSRCMGVNRPDAMLIQLALGDHPSTPNLFGKYGETAEDRALTLASHSLRHLQNTELFRLGVADTIISKRYNRKSVAQSYEYDHRSLAEDLDLIEIPEDIEFRLGEKSATVARLIASDKIRGPIVDSFRRIQTSEGDVAAFEYLKIEADGFHATPYGYCMSSFTVDPCPNHLE